MIQEWQEKVERLQIQLERTERKAEVLSNMLKEAVNEYENSLEELRQAKAKADEASQAKSLFLANMSHELRTPLNIIMGYAQLMQKSVLSPTEQQDYLSTINRNGEHLLALINDVLEISRIEAGQLTLKSKLFDLPALFGDLKKAFASSINTKGLQFEMIGIEDLPPYVAADEGKLRQVLVNILDNAVKFTEQGGITVKVATNDKAAGTMRLAVEVQDTGAGIAEDELHKVFASFEQTASGGAKKSGTGLGMAISRDYVRRMGGDIAVASKAGKGSRFRFEIDVKKGRQKDLAAQDSRRPVKGLQPGQKVPRVLVAEDQRDIRDLLVKILKTAGFEVQAVVNGQAALEMCGQWRPDFIWMDIRMPVMDGLEATRRIKKTEAGRSTIVAAITAHALEEEKERILAAGCDDFVRKPFGEGEILAVTAKHLGLQYVYEAAPMAPYARVESETQVTLQQLAALPADLRGRLLDAVIALDKEQILALIEQIKTVDDHLAKALDTSVKKFALSHLLDLLEKIQRPSRQDSQ